MIYWVVGIPFCSSMLDVHGSISLEAVLVMGVLSFDSKLTFCFTPFWVNLCGGLEVFQKERPHESRIHSYEGQVLSRNNHQQDLE